MSLPPPPDWALVIPVKPLDRAKSRLAGLAGPHRGELALAMAVDTVSALLACPAVAVAIVVTDDPAAGAELGALGSVVIPDRPAAGLNPALEFGAAFAAERWPGRGRAGLAADLPALRPAEIGAALAAAGAVPEPAAFVPDAAGTGTTLYAVGLGAEFRPAFGPGSAARHAARGAAELGLPGIGGLRQDVDTAEDLSRAAALGLGPRTTAVAARLLTRR
jgi:2-phospho-L-lactate guanylyltransferase